MSYQVLARRWRPQNFEDVVGQDHVTRTLRGAIQGDRLAHAFLFAGARGVGKTSVARILAKCLNCVEGGDGPVVTPCDQCVECRDIRAGTSVDVIEIDGASNRGIDEIRELRENIRYLPARARHKVMIIDEVHMLTREAFNALLKTLEEPPAHVSFIMATTEPHKVPVTILSRCQRHDFKRVSAALLLERLVKIAAAEGVSLPEESLRLLAREAEGSVRDALSLFDQMLSFAGEALSADQVAEALGLVSAEVIYRLAGAIIARDAAAGLAEVEAAFGFGVEMKTFFASVLGHFRRLMLVKVMSDPQEDLELTADELEALTAQASPVSLEDVLQMVDGLLAGEEGLRYTAHPRLVVEMTVLKLTALPPVLPLDDILRRMRQMGQEADVSPGVGPAEGSAAPAGPGEGPPSPRGDWWTGFLEAAAAEVGPTARAGLRACRLVEAGEDEIVVARPANPLAREELDRPEVKAKLTEALSRARGRRVTLRWVNGDATEEPTGRDAGPAEPSELVEADPRVGEVVDMFQGQIVEVTPKG
ncbi:MAG: DNA polymerase III subunit gamma/tau [Proteobacteria bacterium]|nr:DNA polymerase III subunit gamma/tau [Pseudomonadota bacterium]MBU1740126.1 DNA polymerase III subunit gamma/tau [Pseudomonadota bacterium]